MSTGRPPEPLRRGSKPSTRPWRNPTQALQTTTTMRPALRVPDRPPSRGPCRNRRPDIRTTKPKRLPPFAPDNIPTSCLSHNRRRASRPATARAGAAPRGNRCSSCPCRNPVPYTRTTWPRHLPASGLRKTPSNYPCRTRLPDRRTRIPKPPRPSGRGNIPTSCLWYISRADLRNAPHDNSREGSRSDPCEETARRRFRRRGHPRSAACRPEGAPARTTGLKSTFSSSIGLLLQF